MNKKVRLAGALGALTTASIAVTAFTLPQFNSLDSYLYRPTNWTEVFASKNSAIDFLNNSENNELFLEVEEGKRVVNEYVIKAALAGIDSNYFGTIEQALEHKYNLTDDINAVDEYNKAKESFTTLVTNYLMTGLSAGNDVYIPKSSLVSGEAFTSPEISHSIYEYYRGSNDSTHTSSLDALYSLLDNTGVVYRYNGSDYNTVDALLVQYMIDSGFANDSAFKEVIHHLSWEARGTYTDTNGNDHSFLNYDYNPATTAEKFKQDMEDAFMFQMKTWETYEQYQYDRSDWYSTSDYIATRDTWMNDPNNGENIPMAVDKTLKDGSLGEAFGFYRDDTYWDVASEMIHTASASSSQTWIVNAADNPSLTFAPNWNYKLEDTQDIEVAVLIMMAWLGPEFDYKQPHESAYAMGNFVNNTCNDNGTLNTSSNEWKSWEKFSKFMGFDQIEIPVSDRPLYNNNTVADWWVPDCEGVFSKNLGLTEQYQLLNDWFMPYFGTELNSNYNSWMGTWLYWGNASKSKVMTTTTTHKIPANTNNPYAGLSITEAIFHESIDPATEADYQDSSDASGDFVQWENGQDIIYIWDKKQYKGSTESEAKSSVNAAIESRIQSDLALMSFTADTETLYDIQDSHADIIRAIDPTINIKDYLSIEAARTAVRASIINNGLGDIWTEEGVYKFIDDSFYNFKTDMIFNTVDEARLFVSWDSVNSTVWSNPNAGATFSSLVEYDTSTVIQYIGFNGSSTDVMFDMTREQIAERMMNGYDLSSIDSSFEKISFTVGAAEKTGVYEEFYTHKFSLMFDSVNEDLTKWVVSGEFKKDTEQQIEALEAARKELIQYWIDYIGA